MKITCVSSALRIFEGRPAWSALPADDAALQQGSDKAMNGFPRGRDKKKNENVSPILEQIMTGGSSVSFNVLQMSHGIEPENLLFQTSALNNCIIFKYPNFDDKSESLDDDDGDTLNLREAAARPIETALYVPHTSATPRAGGYGIYLRGKNYRPLLQEMFGIDEQNPQGGALHDLKVLDAIDSIPSLDAFLLKICFEAERLSIDSRYLRINEDEEMQIRHMIGGRIEPIIRKALGIPEGVGPRIERFLQAIWDPAMPEARTFVTAFGIEHAEADLVFGAWKGITFYEYQLRRLAPNVRSIVKWLKSPDCLPIDLRSHKMYEANLLMYIERVGKQIEGALNDIRAILADYENCFRTFMDGSPEPFREFLRNVRKKYWLMGYCISALNSLSHTHNRFMRNAVNKRLFFEVMLDMLRQFDVALDRRREQRMAF